MEKLGAHSRSQAGVVAAIRPNRAVAAGHLSRRFGGHATALRFLASLWVRRREQNMEGRARMAATDRHPDTAPATLCGIHGKVLQAGGLHVPDHVLDVPAAGDSRLRYSRRVAWCTKPRPRMTQPAAAAFRCNDHGWLAISMRWPAGLVPRKSCR